MKRLQEESFFIVNQGILVGDAWRPFAFEEVLMQRAERLPVVHIWRHARAFIAGMRDRRLPRAEEALRRLRQEGYATVVRNSGGAAVPLHEGVLNISVIFPRTKGTLDIYDDFAWMVDFLSAVLAPLNVRFERGEVRGSYCPGEYDLSIRGRKFCGIAQRRRIEAYTVQAFVIVEGDGMAAGQIAKRFYEEAAGGRDDLGAPQVRPETMASLLELTGHVTMDKFTACLMDRLYAWGGREDRGLISRYEDDVREQIERMRRRYDQTSGGTVDDGIADDSSGRGQEPL